MNTHTYHLFVLIRIQFNHKTYSLINADSKKYMFTSWLRFITQCNITGILIILCRNIITGMTRINEIWFLCSMHCHFEWTESFSPSIIYVLSCNLIEDAYFQVCGRSTEEREQSRSRIVRLRHYIFQ